MVKPTDHYLANWRLPQDLAVRLCTENEKACKALHVDPTAVNSDRVAEIKVPKSWDDFYFLMHENGSSLGDFARRTAFTREDHQKVVSATLDNIAYNGIGIGILGGIIGTILFRKPIGSLAAVPAAVIGIGGGTLISNDNIARDRNIPADNAILSPEACFYRPQIRWALDDLGNKDGLIEINEIPTNDVAFMDILERSKVPPKEFLEHWAASKLTEGMLQQNVGTAVKYGTLFGAAAPTLLFTVAAWIGLYTAPVSLFVPVILGCAFAGGAFFGYLSKFYN